MRDWNLFWNSIDTKQGNDKDWSSMMAQVGRTLKGQPINDEQFKKSYQKIVEALSLEKSDSVLDLCCGNGVITIKIADYVDSIFGVDFSQPLIDVANRCKPANAVYFCGSALDGATLTQFFNGRKFEKIYMNESLQNFSEHEFSEVLDSFMALSQDQALFYITGIPEKKNLFSFYDTEERRKNYYESMACGTEPIGTWWDREFLEAAAIGRNLDIKTLDQAPDFYTRHYRFDAMIKKI